MKTKDKPEKGVVFDNVHYEHQSDGSVKFFVMEDGEKKYKKLRIRKLTPRECFRLMDVDEHYIDAIQNARISKSAQYKLAGNSIVVSCLFHIFRKMFVDTQSERIDKDLFDLMTDC